MAAIAYIYIAECKCNSTCERKRKVTKNQGLRGGERKLLSPEVRSYYLLVLIRNAFPIYIYRDVLYSREVADQRQDLDYLSEGTARTRDSHKTDFRAPWAPIVAVDRTARPDLKNASRRCGSHISAIPPSCGMRAECETRGEERFQPANVSLRDRGQKIKPDETTEIKREK